MDSTGADDQHRNLSGLPACVERAAMVSTLQECVQPLCPSRRPPSDCRPHHCSRAAADQHALRMQRGRSIAVGADAAAITAAFQLHTAARAAAAGSQAQCSAARAPGAPGCAAGWPPRQRHADLRAPPNCCHAAYHHWRPSPRLVDAAAAGSACWLREKGGGAVDVHTSPT